MVRTVKLRKMGGSIGATIPKDLAERLHLDVGDEVFVVPTDEGLLITPYDPTFHEAMAAGAFLTLQVTSTLTRFQGSGTSADRAPDPADL